MVSLSIIHAPSCHVCLMDVFVSGALQTPALGESQREWRNLQRHGDGKSCRFTRLIFVWYNLLLGKIFIHSFLHSWNDYKRKPDGRNTLTHTLILLPGSPQQKCLVGDFFGGNFFIAEVLLLQFLMCLCCVTRCGRLRRRWRARS